MFFRETAALQPFVFESLLLLLDEFLRIDEFVHVLAGRDFLHDGRFFFGVLFTFGSPFDEHRMVIDQIVQAKTKINEAFDSFQSVFVDVLPDLGCVIRHDVHHFAVGLREPNVVLEEITMAVNMRHDELLIDQVVALQQIRVARVIINDHLVNLLQAVGVALVEALVFHAELPVGIPVREPTVGGNHVHFFEVEDLENGFVKIQSIAARVLLDLAVEPRQFGRQRLPVALNRYRHYFPLPRKSLMDW